MIFFQDMNGMLIAHNQMMAFLVRRKDVISLSFKSSNQSFFHSTCLIFLLAFMYAQHKEKILFKLIYYYLTNLLYHPKSAKNK